MQHDGAPAGDAPQGRKVVSPNNPRPFPPALVAGRILRLLGKAVLTLVALLGVSIVAVAEFPDQLSVVLPSKIAQLLPPPLPKREPLKAAYWLEQNWSTEDRHWFHHVTQGTEIMPYSWFVALEQPGLRLVGNPGMLADSAYLERFGFIPSPRSIHADAASLRHYGYSPAADAKTELAASVAGLRPTAGENSDGLPVGFARLSGAVNPATGATEADKIGLTCALCHTGSIRYNGVSVRFDGGPAMVDLDKFQSAIGLSIIYTLKVPGRFSRFAARVLGPNASQAEYDKLERELTSFAGALLVLSNSHAQTIKNKGQRDEGFGRTDALNRIGNQVFYADLVKGGLSGFEDNQHANDAPVSYPPIWTAPWFLWAQYDASIGQPLIRNAGEVLGVSAALNLSPNAPREALFRSSIAVENLARIEVLLRGPDPFATTPPAFGGLTSPKWPAQFFPDDPAWKIDETRADKGRKIFAQICAECHLGPINDPVFDKQYPDKAFWSSKQWSTEGPVLWLVEKGVKEMGTDPAQSSVIATRSVRVPGFLDIQPKRILAGCSDIPATSGADMTYALAALPLIELVLLKWMDDHNMSEADRKTLWGERKNCPNTVKAPVYRARPLNGVWATPPFLHNGSVPSLYWLLRPASERPRSFCVGDRDFDPKQVGFHVEAGGETSCKTGETLFSMTDSNGPINGNSVLGHSLEGTPGPGKPGVIGRLLTEDERYDLIEYLKTL